MTVLVTGGAGFIGSCLVVGLLKRGESVRVFDNLSSGSRSNICGLMDHEGFEFYQGNISEPSEIRGALQGCDVVYHLAANPEVRAGIEATDIDLKTGTIATYNVLEAMRLNRIRKVLFNSSSTVYGDVGATPVTEDNGPLLPI